jgi:hypothetical protein
VVHRDVKPANMFVLHDDRLKIFDFGIAKKVNTDWTLTQPGVGMGTAAYMSPEQSISADMADKLSDLYSLGCAMYEMLTGLPPFGRGAEWTTLADMHRHAIPQPPRDLRPVPPALSDLVLRLLAKKPKERPQSASAVAAELKDISAGVTSDNRRPGEEAGFVSPPGDRSRKVPPRKVTAAELREMGPERAAVVLERLSSRRLAAEALNALASSEVAAILKLVSSGRAARYLGVVPPQHAAQVLEAMKRSRGAEILASFSSAEEAAALLGVMSPESAARLTATVNEKFLADVLVELNRPHNLEILDAMAISRRRSVVEHMTSADSQTLRQLAEKRLEEAESQIREMEELERQEKARHRLQDDRMPWTWAVRSSVCLLLVTTVAFDVGATAWKWESWPWLLLFIPVGLISVAGIYCAANAWFTGVAMATSGSALFLVAALFSALLVVQAVPKAAGMPVVVLAALSGAAVACWQMWAEDDHYSSVQQARRLGELAKHGSGGGSRGRSRGLFLALIRA